jgi:hypothetical protein
MNLLIILRMWLDSLDGDQASLPTHEHMRSAEGILNDILVSLLVKLQLNYKLQRSVTTIYRIQSQDLHTLKED